MACFKKSPLFPKLFTTALPLFLFLSLYHVDAELFTSMADMELLLQSEQTVANVIDLYIEAEMARLERLRKVSDQYQEHNAKAVMQGSDYIANPINAYVMIQRLTSQWTHAESLMKENSAEEFLQNITYQRESLQIRLPDKDDLNGAAQALFRLQDTYNLQTSDMASGRIHGARRTQGLSAFDCFELGRYAYTQNDYYHVVMWMQEAVDKVHREKPPTIAEEEILEYLAFGLYHQGNLKRSLKLTKRLQYLNPDHPRAAGNIKYYEGALAEHGLRADGELPPIVNARSPAEYMPEERTIYEALCRNEHKAAPAVAKHFKCHYKNDTPFLMLAPLKYEVVHLKPKIIIFRNVISDEEIEIIKELATPKLKRATVFNRNTGKLEHANYRITKSAWLKDEHHTVVSTVNRRITDMTGFDLETAEDLQIANYGIGGHYDPHFDFSTKDEKDPYEDGTGNRIATVLFYISQPEAGGATVFPELKLTLFPSVRDAAFWHNLYKSSRGDLTTRHAACPVLAGNKWVSNKWIHEIGQEFRRPCGLEEDEYE